MIKFTPNQKPVFRCRFGSHLYGTETPTSDYDEKGVFIESLENIILRKDSRTLHYNTGNDKNKNGKEDVDIEFKELRTFLHEAMDGQTYALDMLFCNDENTLETSPEWRFIQEHRHRLISKNIKPFIGYCRQQAGKYGLKGSRLAELERVISILRTLSPKDNLIARQVTESEFVNYHNDGKVDYLEVLGKKYQLTTHVERTLESLQLMHKKYGERSRMAQANDGVDWKAVSHAYRCMFEVKTLLLTGMIIFPLPESEFLIKVKRGELNWSEINDQLPQLMSEVEEIADKSALPDSPDRSFWNEFILKVYK